MEVKLLFDEIYIPEIYLKPNILEESKIRRGTLFLGHLMQCTQHILATLFLHKAM